MMDIVDRLRQRIALVKFDSDAIALHDAANMIEQLRGQVDFERQCREDTYADLEKQDAEIGMMRRVIADQNASITQLKEALKELLNVVPNFPPEGNVLIGMKERYKKALIEARTALKEMA